MTWLLVILAGAAGTAARYGIQLLVGPRSFPWATLATNVVGSFLIGLVLTLSVMNRLDSRQTAVLAVGFLGAFTTYSTFAWETFTLSRLDRLVEAALYLALSVVLGVVAAAAGYRLGQAL